MPLQQPRSSCELWSFPPSTTHLSPACHSRQTLSTSPGTGYRHQELDCFQMTLAPFRLHRRLQTSSLAFIPSARSRVSDYPLAPLLPSASLMSSSAFVVNSYAIRTFPSD
ncbi:hypothetical protein CLIM01_11965 [Colletotrichum limetticola]|uniref:Uncharacterized protein n=1 Tax=Colletotrichum limetticola TaxID=1209924 RepID=A0ABQ9PF09_9PEZI|nr:hypothetical protein CLIM01_11965 [Colletotrichum limetticola]